MCRRTWRAGAALLAGLGLIAAAPLPQRIVAIGDLHGDFAAWRAIARAAGLIDAQATWRGGRTILVQTGDVVDRGPNSLAIIQDLMRLQREARRAGGSVVALIGNHEAMNATDDLRYATPGDFAAFADAQSVARRDAVYAANRDVIETGYKQQDPTLSRSAIHQAWLAANPLGLIEHQSAWHAHGFIGHWLADNPAVVVIGDTLFVHGGISPAYAGWSPLRINRLVGTALSLLDHADMSIINDPDGPLWYRGLAVSPNPKTEAELDGALRAFHARRMVIAHTPLLSGIALLYDGKLARIDSGISSYYGGKLTYLEIAGSAMTAHEVTRP